MSGELDAVLESLAGLLGRPLHGIRAECDRLHWYFAASDRGIGIDLLLRAVALEDSTNATSLVIRMLEIVPDEEHADWLNQLAPENRRYSEVRSAEIRILRRARCGALPVVEISDNLDSWTDWLQRRLAKYTDDPEALAILADRGRTRRIRVGAAERLKGRPAPGL